MASKSGTGLEVKGTVAALVIPRDLWCYGFCNGGGGGGGGDVHFGFSSVDSSCDIVGFHSIFKNNII
jgi:hypothetical protein